VIESVEFWPKLLVGALATWRLTHLLAREDGPAEIVARARSRLGDGWLRRMVECFDCLSLAVAAPVALWLTMRLDEWCWTWLALSGAAGLCDRVGQPAVSIARLPESTEEGRDGVLRPPS
jgi:hypothetical protein